MYENMKFLPDGIGEQIINETTPIVPGEYRVCVDNDYDVGLQFFSIYKYNSMNLEDITYIDSRLNTDFFRETAEESWNAFYQWVKSNVQDASVKFFEAVIDMYNDMYNANFDYDYEE